MQGGSARANVFRDGIGGLRHHETADSVEAAVQASIAWVDGWHADKQADRTREGGRVIGSQADFEDALAVVQISDAQRLMLQAHYRATNRTLTATELARAAGYSDYVTANNLYGRLGKAVADAAGLPPAPAQRRDDAVVWTGVLAWGTGEPDEHGQYRWRMYDALARAIAALNMG